MKCIHFTVVIFKLKAQKTNLNQVYFLDLNMHLK